MAWRRTFSSFPDGSRFAVADPRGMGDTSRSVGFLVENFDEALAFMRSSGVALAKNWEKTPC